MGSARAYLYVVHMLLDISVDVIRCDWLCDFVMSSPIEYDHFFIRFPQYRRKCVRLYE